LINGVITTYDFAEHQKGKSPRADLSFDVFNMFGRGVVGSVEKRSVLFRTEAVVSRAKREYFCLGNPLEGLACSGQLKPDTILSFFSASAGVSMGFK
jgi:hypothetical protein